MTGRPAFSKGSALILVAAMLAAGSLPAFAEATVHSRPGVEVRGKVVDQNGRPAEGVIILAYHLATEELYTATTGPGAEFLLTSLPAGYYDFAAKSLDGFYVGDQVANVMPSGDTKLQLRLQDYGSEAETDRWYFPGSDDKPTGIALMVDGIDGPGFWSRPSSKYIVGGGGALVLAALGGGGGGGQPPASAFLP
jgi:hypothetical protein